MNELISRKNLLAEYDRVHIGEPGKARKLIEEAPRADAVEVIRCKECENAIEGNHGLVCPMWGSGTEPNAFCSYGKKKKTAE